MHLYLFMSAVIAYLLSNKIYLMIHPSLNFYINVMQSVHVSVHLVYSSTRIHVLVFIVQPTLGLVFFFINDSVIKVLSDAFSCLNIIDNWMLVYL